MERQDIDGPSNGKAVQRRAMSRNGKAKLNTD